MLVSRVKIKGMEWSTQGARIRVGRCFAESVIRCMDSSVTDKRDPRTLESVTRRPRIVCNEAVNCPICRSRCNRVTRSN